MLALGATDRGRLEQLVTNRNTAQKHVLRARIVLLLADGVAANAVQRHTGASQPTITAVRRRIEKSYGSASARRSADRRPDAIEH